MKAASKDKLVRLKYYYMSKRLDFDDAYDKKINKINIFLYKYDYSKSIDRPTRDPIWLSLYNN